MQEVTKPRVRSIATGKELVAKQMQAEAGDLLPEHLADLESILFVHEGECNLRMNDEYILLKQGKGYVIPPDTRHQIKALTAFKGLHIMPKEIKITYL